jgi:hypothetical protein
LYIEACGMFTQLMRSPEVPDDMRCIPSFSLSLLSPLFVCSFDLATAVMRERLTAYTIRTEIVERLQQQQTKQTYKQQPAPQQQPLYLYPPAQLPSQPPHPYLTQGQYPQSQYPQSQYPAYPVQQQPIFNPSPSTPSTHNPTSTPVSNPVPFGMQPGQTRYVDPLHRPTLFERLKRLGL